MRTLAVVLALAAACVPVSASAAREYSPDAAFERRVALELQVLQELNRARAARGLGALRNATGLRSAAASHSQAMLRLGFFGHDSPDGTAFYDRIRRHYPDRGWGRWAVGEALFANSGEIAAHRVVSIWLQSRAHRELILSAKWRDAGIGAVYRPFAGGPFGGVGTIAVTADFGLRAGRKDAGK